MEKYRFLRKNGMHLPKWWGPKAAPDLITRKRSPNLGAALCCDHFWGGFLGTCFGGVRGASFWGCAGCFFLMDGQLGVCIVLVVSWQGGVVHERPGLGLLQFGIAARNVDHLVGWMWGRQLLPGYGERLCCETFFVFLASPFF